MGAAEKQNWIWDDFEDFGVPDPKFSVFTFFASFVLKHNAPLEPKKIENL